MGATQEVHGAAAAAETFSGRARAARLALIDGQFGLVWAQGGKPQVVFAFGFERGKIVEIEMVGNPDRIRELDVATVDD